VWVFVCMCVCERERVCVCVRECVWMSVFVCLCVCVCLSACVRMCLCVWVRVCVAHSRIAVSECHYSLATPAIWYVWHDSLVSVTRLIHICDMPWVKSHMSHVTHESRHTWEDLPYPSAEANMNEWVMSHKWMSHVSRMSESCLTNEKT